MPSAFTLVPRQLLVPVNLGLWSSSLWPDGIPGRVAGTRARLAETRNGSLGPVVVIEQVLVLRNAVAKAGGCLYVIQLMRSWADQRKLYEDGKSPVDAGYSTHQSGHGVDFSWTGITDAQFFELATALGWVNVAGDDPHWEWHGIWARLREAHGPGQMAMAAIIDQGLRGGHSYEGSDNYGTDAAAALQVGVWRALRKGCGRIDGHVGPLTLAGLDELKMSPAAEYQDLYRLLSAA